MNNLLQYLNKNKIYDLSKIDYQSFDFLISRKDNLIGISLKNSLLILNYNRFCSYRANLCNINLYTSFALVKHRENINKDHLEEYFLNNNDNPYALKHVIDCIYLGKLKNDFTQFPPLVFKKNKQQQLHALKNIYDKAELGDLVFSYDRSCNISKMIRKYDRGMWSHVGGVDKNKRIVHMTTSGIKVSELDEDFNSESMDVGLYRIKGGLDEKGKISMQAHIEENINRNYQYSWFKLFLVFLKKEYNFPIQMASVADLLHSNHFQLISYA